MKNVYLQSIFMGIIAGMRSMSAPALVSDYLADKQSPEIENSNFKLLASENVATTFKVLAVGEMIADKTPFIPNRISPAPLIGRAISGAICGASLCRDKGERSEVGALAGGLSALASAYGVYYLRKRLGEEGIPDVLLGLIEDSIVIKAGMSILEETE
jgi:uncharacterized membrane protein